MTTAFTTRPATIDDCRAIAEVHVASWQTTYRGQFPDRFLDELSVPEREERWRESFLLKKWGDCLVAERDGAVVGFVNYGQGKDADAIAGGGEVYAIYLLSSAQGMGIGACLWNQALDCLRAQGFREARVWVLDTNYSARRFYERMGCVLEGAQKPAIIDGAEIIEVRYCVAL